ncbi:MAG TPA: dTMP kinase [Steroidobacteraceae bacterium]|nr:dTMP kinase [Steroidobacteraceae bacterium]
MRGKFITLEGLEGSGKSTQIARLERHLAARGIEVTVTREPGGTPLAEKLRQVVLSPGNENISPEAELLVMFAARAVHLDNLIRPALDAGRWVLCDRFTDASFAYQGAGRGVGDEVIASLENLVQGELRPDLTLLLDLPVEVGLRRAAARRGREAPDRFELEGSEFFQRVRASFLALAAKHAQRIRVIDADRPLEEVTADLIAQVDSLLAGTTRP